MTEKQKLPKRWAYKHKAYYYRPPADMVKYWGSQWYRLGTTFDGAMKSYKEKLSAIAGSEAPELNSLLDERSILASAISVCGPAIYFLIKGTKIVYVGKSKNVIQRLTGHSGKDFTRVATLPCSEQDLDLLEVAYIAKYRPKYNFAISETGNGEMYFSEASGPNLCDTLPSYDISGI